MKRLLAILILIGALMVQGHSVQTISQCNQANITWISNEVYDINLANPDISVSGGGQCIDVNGFVNNISFNQVNDLITIEADSGSYNFIEYQFTTSQDFQFNDFNIEVVEGSDAVIFFNHVLVTNGAFLVDNIVTDSTFRGLDYIFIAQTGTAPVGGSRVEVDGSKFINTQIYDAYNVIFARQCSGCTTPTTQDIYFEDSVAVLNEVSGLGLSNSDLPGLIGGIDVLDSPYRTNYNYHRINYNDSVVTKKEGSGILVVDVSPSLIGNDLTLIDNDNDNIDDSNVNRLITKKMYGTTYMVDLAEGLDILGVEEDNGIYFPTRFETILVGAEHVITGNSNVTLKMDNSNIEFRQNGGIVLGNDVDLTCNDLRFNEDQCYFADSDEAGTYENNKFNGLITVSSNNIISGAILDIVNNQTLDVNVISNVIDGELDTINIEYNTFNVNNNQNINSPTDEDVQSSIKLRGDNIIITGNTFLQYNDLLDPSNYHNLIYIDSGDNSLNEIYLNNFQAPGGALTTVLSNQCDATLYHNNLSVNVTPYTNCDTAPLLNKVVGYEHTDSMIYYFTLGNYYADNTGCVDAGGDGKCDSPYVTGTFTDSNALSSYPFDFVAQLGNADSSSNLNENYNITITTPIQNSSVEIEGVSSNINVSFSHDSTFPDLTCDYIVNDVVILSARLYNTDNSLQSQGFTGWDEGSNSVKVNCFNDFQNLNSTQIDFTVSYTGTTGNETTDGGSGSFAVEEFDFVDLNDPDGTTDNVIEAFEDIGAFIWNIAFPGLVGLIVIGGILFVGVLLR